MQLRCLHLEHPSNKRSRRLHFILLLWEIADKVEWRVNTAIHFIFIIFFNASHHLMLLLHVASYYLLTTFVGSNPIRYYFYFCFCFYL